jgi:hypothetical protein
MLCKCNKNNCRKHDISSIPTSDTAATVAPADEDTAPVAVVTLPAGMIAGALTSIPATVANASSLPPPPPPHSLKPHGNTRYRLPGDKNRHKTNKNTRCKIPSHKPRQGQGTFEKTVVKTTTRRKTSGFLLQQRQEGKQERQTHGTRFGRQNRGKKREREIPERERDRERDREREENQGGNEGRKKPQRRKQRQQKTTKTTSAKAKRRTVLCTVAPKLYAVGSEPSEIQSTSNGIK